MEPRSTASIDYVETENEAAQPKSTNPLLCQQCQAWDDYLNFQEIETFRGDHLRLVELSSNEDYLIYRAIVSAVDARREGSDAFPP
jgi:hypothetical protein